MPKTKTQDKVDSRSQDPKAKPKGNGKGKPNQKSSSSKGLPEAELGGIIELCAGKLSLLSPSDRGKVLARLCGVFGFKPKGPKADTGDASKDPKPAKAASVVPAKPHNEAVKGTLVDQALRYTSSLVAKQSKEKRIIWAVTATHKYLLHAHKSVSVPLKEATDDNFLTLKEKAIEQLGGEASREDAMMFAKQFIVAVKIHATEGHFGKPEPLDPSALLASQPAMAILDEVASCLRHRTWFSLLNQEEFEKELRAEIAEDMFFERRISPPAETALVPAGTQPENKAETEKEKKRKASPRNRGKKARIDPSVPDGRGPARKAAPKAAEAMDTDTDASASVVGPSSASRRETRSKASPSESS
jgi:hypothetical protein